MTSSAKNKKDQLTVMIFKDNLAARSFQVPLKWISQFGFLLTIGLIVTLLSILGASKFYTASKKSTPAHVIDLESEIKDLQTLNQNLESQINELESRVQKKSESSVQSGRQQSTGLLFVDLSEKISTASSADHPAITVTKKQAIHSQQGQTSIIRVSFLLEYNRKDGGKQEGKIILLAKGNQSLISFPQNTFNTSGRQLIDHEKGEYFLVSRVRPVVAEMEVVKGSEVYSTVEVLIFDSKNTLIIRDQITVEKTNRPSREANPSQTDAQKIQTPVETPASQQSNPSGSGDLDP